MREANVRNLLFPLTPPLSPCGLTLIHIFFKSVGTFWSGMDQIGTLY